MMEGREESRGTYFIQGEESFRGEKKTTIATLNVINTAVSFDLHHNY